MKADVVDRGQGESEIRRAHPETQRVQLDARRFSMLVIYYGFIFVVAFDKPLLAIKIGATVTLGFPIGIGVILSAIIITGLYVAAGQWRLRPADPPDRRGGALMFARSDAPARTRLRSPRRSARSPCRPWRPAPISGQAQQQATNVTAIAMFIGFVMFTLFITYWAAKRTRTASDFYTAGGGITGFQNGLAIAGDYMSAASFLGISALVYATGYDGLIYLVGFLVGWPIIVTLMAERLRNLGRFTFADVASATGWPRPRCACFAASGTLVVVAFYLIAQMVGAGQLIKLLFGLDYSVAVVLVGVLMVVYVTFGGMLATTWVQIIKAGLLLGGATLMAVLVLLQFGFDPTALFARAVEVHPNHDAIMLPGNIVANPVEAISLGLALMFGTAGLPHILMRFFTVADARRPASRCSGRPPSSATSIS